MFKSKNNHGPLFPILLVLFSLQVFVTQKSISVNAQETPPKLTPMEQRTSLLGHAYADDIATLYKAHRDLMKRAALATGLSKNEAERLYGDMTGDPKKLTFGYVHGPFSVIALKPDATGKIGVVRNVFLEPVKSAGFFNVFYRGIKNPRAQVFITSNSGSFAVTYVDNKTGQPVKRQ